MRIYIILMFCFQYFTVMEFATVVFQYKSEAVLSCIYSNDTFFYTDTTTSISTNIIADNSKYFRNVKADFQRNYWCNSTSSSNIAFNKQVAPFLYQVDTLSLTATEEKSIDISCWLLVGTESNPYQNLTWEWFFGGSSIANSGQYSIKTNTNTSSTLTINSLTTSNKGEYKCTVSNSYGNHSRTTTLRVKSKLSPLWPFLGFLGELGILLGAIGVYEFKKRSSEKIYAENQDKTTVASEGAQSTSELRSKSPNSDKKSL